MHDIKKILCVIDPTTEAQPAMQRAAWLAKATSAELTLLICYYNEYLSGERFFDAPSLEKARKEVMTRQEDYLESVAAPLRKDGLSVKTAAVWDHPLYEGIVRVADKLGANVVFKDTHYHSATSRLFLTNTDWNLIRTCASPLWLVKPRDMQEHPVFIGSIDPMNDNDKPAALDDEILEISRYLAERTGGTVHAFHAFDPRMAIATATANAYVPVSLPYDEIEEQMREQHGKRFNEITKFHKIDDKNAHLVAGATFEELPDLTDELKADVCVMGAVSRNPWKRLFIGATAEKVMDHLPCDLLIVKPDWFKTPVQLSEKAA
ncbi:MAG: universal stress protein [Gammaproteobacteria bacterium]|nr:universal stress protein [Gammaproteobacteria bacterium]